MHQKQMEAFYTLTLAVRRMFHKAGNGLAALHQDSPVSVGMRAVLESVIDGGPQTVPQVARVRPVTRQHIQSLVNALLDSGYVEYAENPAHKRSKLVQATERGMREFRSMRERETGVFRRIPIDLTPAEMQGATRVLHDLIDTFDGPGWRALVAEYAPNLDMEESDDASQ